MNTSTIRLNRSHQGIVILAGLVVMVPYVLTGFGFILDDWSALSNAKIDGWYLASGSDQWTARPGAALTYALTFGWVGNEPLIHWFLLAVTLISVSLLLYSVLHRRWGRNAALVVTLIWIAVPNHTSMEGWSSTLNINIALILLLWGVKKLDSASTYSQLGAVLLIVSIFFYEAVIPIVIATLLLKAWERRSAGEPWKQSLTTGMLAVSVSVTWLLSNIHPAKQGVGQLIQPQNVIRGHFADLAFGSRALGLIGVLLVLIGTVITLRNFLKSGERGWQEEAILTGWIILGLGTAPFVTYFYEPLGVGDRVTLVSGFGGAMILAGILTLLYNHIKLGGALVGLLLLTGVVDQRYTMVKAYTQSYTDAQVVIAHIKTNWSTLPEDRLVFSSPVMHNNVAGIIFPLDAMFWIYETRDVDAVIFYDEEDFTQAEPGSGKVNLQELIGS